MIADHLQASPFLLSVLVVLTIWILSIWKKSSRLPPGPWGLPVLGYFPFLSSKPYLDFCRLAKHYGSVFSFRTLGGTLIVVVNGVEATKDIFVKRADEFIGRPKQANFIEWISDGLGITQEEGALWKEHRRFFISSTKSRGFGKVEMEFQIHEEIKELMEEIRKTNYDSSSAKFHISYAMHSIASQVLFSKKYDKFSQEFSETFKGALEVVKLIISTKFLVVGPFFLYGLIKIFPTVSEQLKETYRKNVKAIIEEHVKSFDPDNLRDYIDDYLYQRKILMEKGNIGNQSFTLERLEAIALNMLMESTETPSGTLMSFLLELSKHPEVQETLQRELDTVIGRNGRMPSWNDRQDLPYLRAVIEELSRVAMPFNISTLHSNFEETSINGYRIPRRTVIVANFWSLHNDPTLFPNPEKFDPQRYLTPDGKFLKLEAPFLFGVGKRACVGESLGRMLIFLFLSSLLQHFTLISGNQEDTFVFKPRNKMES